ncbi:MAG TPA: hypothetical protein VJ201_03195 [Candidatus Babeliales bacterium]|nr:hypothetical protein [Candidatus Babeliales bacterium]
MIITKSLVNKLFIAAFIMITLIGSHQLNAMEPQLVKASEKISLDADFQAYLVLSTLNNDHQCYLFPELVQIIATNVSKLIDKDCYEEHGGKYLNHPNSLLCFIENSYKDMSHTHAANILKRCLNHSGKSLGEIKDKYDTTVFHQIAYPRRNKVLVHVEWIKILCLVAGNETWNIICMKNYMDYTPLLYASSSADILNALLSTAPDYQEAWNLILTPCKCGDTVLDRAKLFHSTKSTELLESYRPKEQ